MTFFIPYFIPQCILLVHVPVAAKQFFSTSPSGTNRQCYVASCFTAPVSLMGGIMFVFFGDVGIEKNIAKADIVNFGNLVRFKFWFGVCPESSGLSTVRF